MRKIFLFFIVLICASLVQAQEFKFANGSWEQDTNFWSISFPQTVGTNSICGGTSTGPSGTVVTGWATDGNHSLKSTDNSAGFNFCTQLLSTVNNDFNGNIRAVFDYNVVTGGGGAAPPRFDIYQKGAIRCNITWPGSGTIGTAQCKMNPNVSDFNIAFVINTGSIANITDVRLDNFRWQRLPIIKTDLAPFTTDIFSGDTFPLFIDYNAAGSCTVRDTNTGQTYSASHVSGDLFRVSDLSYQTGSNVSISRTFDLNCDGVSNSDSSWKVRINRDPLVADGSFERNCASSDCAYPASSQIGTDWNVYTGSADIITSNYLFGASNPLIATSGNHMITLHAPGTQTVELRSTTLLNGGTVYYDLIRHYVGFNTGFQIWYYKVAGGTSNLYTNSLSSDISGSDKNVTIPNEPGYIAFRFSDGFGTGSNLDMTIDNVRYTSPKFNTATACKSVIYNGDTDNKIDLVFTGSGFSSTAALKSASEFAVDYNGNGNGIMSFEPFKSYKDKFNIWYVDLNKTYNSYPGSSHWKFDFTAIENATQSCPWGNEFVMLSVTPRVWPHAYLEQNLVTPTGNGAHWAFVTVGCELTGDCNYPLDINRFNPYDPICQGDGNDDACGVDSDAASKIEEAQRLVVHEFGHSFGGLLDEYVNAANVPLPSGGAPNCSDSNVCPAWLSITGTCDPGCTRPNWYKAYDESNATLMFTHGDPRKEFKVVNENELKKDILSYKTAASAPNAYLTYIAHMTFANGIFSLSRLNLVNGASPEFPVSYDNPYNAKIVDINGNTLFDYNFGLPNQIIYEPSVDWFDSNGTQVITPTYDLNENLTDFNFTLSIPFSASAFAAKIYDTNNNLLATVPLVTISYNLSYGSGSILNGNFRMLYNIGGQPSTIISSPSYIGKLGWVIQNG